MVLWVRKPVSLERKYVLTGQSQGWKIRLKYILCVGVPKSKICSNKHSFNSKWNLLVRSQLEIYWKSTFVTRLNHLNTKEEFVSKQKPLQLVIISGLPTLCKKYNISSKLICFHNSKLCYLLLEFEVKRGHPTFRTQVPYPYPHSNGGQQLGTLEACLFLPLHKHVTLFWPKFDSLTTCNAKKTILLTLFTQASPQDQKKKAKMAFSP